MTTHVAGRMLDDDVNVLLRFAEGARGTLRATQVAAGEENGLRLRIHGEKGGLEWSQMEPNTLTLRWLARPAEIVRAGGRASAPPPCPACAPPRAIRRAISRHSATSTARWRRRCGRRRRTGGAPGDFGLVPGTESGLRTMAFVEAVLKSAKSQEKWTAFPVVDASPIRG